MKICNNILDAIGNTPMIKLNKITKDIPATVLAKVEYFNPGHSCKDRMALKMIEDAEKDGRLKPGGTIVEGTSGNTGMGLALAAIVKGYKLICVTTDKQSKEKADILRAMGARVEICPTDVEPTDPRSYYSVSKRLAEETPNGWYVNQYDNPSNAQANYEQTGPEIWDQTDGKVTHFVVGVGTGGTISGIAKYLKEQNPNVRVWGVDTYGSVFKKYHETGIFDENEVYSYVTEGIGEDILPKNVDFSLIDGFTKVTDKDAAVYCRKLALEEGLFVGMSSGSAIKGVLQLKDKFGPEDTVVVLFHDSGSRYVGKIFNDVWMKERGYLVDEVKIASDIVRKHGEKPLITVFAEELVSHATTKLKKFGVSQLPVLKDGKFVGLIDESAVYQALISDAKNIDAPISSVMKTALPIVKESTAIREVSKLINKETPAVLVELSSGKHHIISRQDIIDCML
jgi:cystathionine beta-synthase